MSSVEQKSEARLIAMIDVYAEYDKSDPFCKARCMTHLRQGLLRPLQDGSDATYQATRHADGNGEILWTNLKRL